MGGGGGARAMRTGFTSHPYPSSAADHFTIPLTNQGVMQARVSPTAQECPMWVARWTIHGAKMYSPITRTGSGRCENSRSESKYGTCKRSLVRGRVKSWTKRILPQMVVHLTTHLVRQGCLPPPVNSREPKTRVEDWSSPQTARVDSLPWA